MLSGLSTGELKLLRIQTERRIARLKTIKEVSESNSKMRSLRQFRKEILNHELESN